MTRAIAALAFLIAADSAYAQPVQQPPINPEEQIDATIGQLLRSNIRLHAQTQALQQQVAELLKQLSDAKAAADAAKPKEDVK